MQKILVFFIITLPLFLSAEVYNVPLGSQGNSVTLNLSNDSNKYLENLKIIPHVKEEYFQITKLQNTSSLEINEKKQVEFLFDVSTRVPIDSVFNFYFEISSDNGFHSRKTIGIKITPPEKFELQDNYPNPFNPETNIKYVLPEKSRVSLTIYNLQGRLINNLVNTEQTAGVYKITWNAENLPSGIYFYRIKVKNSQGTKNITKKMMLVK